MTKFKRSLAIDFFKGIAIIGIVFIHTVFVSGWAYVPGYMRNFSLLIDVPLFFFLSGWGSSYNQDYYKKINSIIKLCFRCIYFIVLYTLVIFFVDRDLFKVKDLPHYFLFVVTQPGNIWSDFLGGGLVFQCLHTYQHHNSIFFVSRQKELDILDMGLHFCISTDMV